MKTLTIIEKQELEKNIQLRQSCFEKAQQLNGYGTMPLKTIIEDAKKIESFIKTGK